MESQPSSLSTRRCATHQVRVALKVEGSRQRLVAVREEHHMQVRRAEDVAIQGFEQSAPVMR